MTVTQLEYRSNVDEQHFAGVNASGSSPVASASQFCEDPLISQFC